MRVLVGTHYLSSFQGSELVAWEIAHWFAAQGDEVVLLSPRIGPPMSELPTTVRLVDDPSLIDLPSFDLVWSQHDMVARIPHGLEDCVRRLRLPHVAIASLSPTTPLEHLDGTVADAVGAELWANSAETAHAMAAANRRVVRERSIRIFHNAAPPEYWVQPAPRSPSLGRLLIVSNHVPPEVRHAAAILRASGVAVRIVGARDEVMRIGPDDIAAPDAVLSIGKTVVYALAGDRPVYVYDHLGGYGWLNRASWDIEWVHNFSGRPRQRRLPADRIARDLVKGYAAASQEVSVLRTTPGLRLDEHLAGLRARALRRSSRWRAARLGARFGSRWFRAHLAYVRRYTSPRAAARP